MYILYEIVEDVKETKYLCMHHQGNAEQLLLPSPQGVMYFDNINSVQQHLGKPLKYLYETERIYN